MAQSTHNSDYILIWSFPRRLNMVVISNLDHCVPLTLLMSSYV